jgi:hypothetical protein
MSAAAGSGISEEVLKNLQDSREKLQEAVAELVEEEIHKLLGIPEGGRRRRRATRRRYAGRRKRTLRR